MTLLDQISDALGASDALGDLSSTLGAASADTDSLLSAGLPAILGGLGAQSSDGIGALMGLLGQDKGGLADNLGSFFAQGDKTGLASKLVTSLFGSQRGAIESQVATASGSPLSMVSRFLPMLAPVAMSLLGKITADDDVDADGLTEKLGALSLGGPLSDIFGASTDDDKAGFVEGIASLRDAGGLGALIPSAAAAIPASAKAAAGVAAGTGAATRLVGHDDDSDRRGLGWIPLVALPLMLLIAGLVLWQCGNDATSAATDEDHSSEEVEVAAEPEPEPTAAPEPTAVPDPTPAPEPTPEPAPEPTATPEPAPVVTIADLAIGSADLSTLVATAVQLDLAGTLSDPDAGPFTVFAPTNDAFEAAGGVLERLSEDQVLTAVTYHVVPGVYRAEDLTPGTTLETLTGEILTVRADGTLDGGVNVVTADLEADNGVVHIIDSLLVPGSVRRSLASQDVNTLFELEPIQFDLGQATIRPESVSTLDQAIATLTSLPEGTVFEVQGHTDSQGPDAPNQALSEARAASVVEYLVGGGVSADMLVPVGYGETQLKVDPEVTPEDFESNRRIEFVDIS